ncbi:DUF5320 domain-containing protein [Clostridiaceae bacterium M8S5]|nr:DUF5320 domain-containing protein [Clostridiaceae bacterium M8S5]
MPGRDGTGPYGEGKMTGRGFGACSTEENNVRELRGFAGGRKRGARCGKGRPRRFFMDRNNQQDT